MPRPRPLTNVSSARPDPFEYQVLTPRTPHTRSGRAEEGFAEVEVDQLHESDDDYRTLGQQQAAPLLRSSAEDSFPPSGFRSRGDDYDERRLKGGKGGLTLSLVMSRLPMITGVALAGALLALTILSYMWPGALHEYLGTSPPQSESSAPALATSGKDDFAIPSTTTSLAPHPTHSNSQILSYENYTQFPLLPSEYRAECRKLNEGYMTHGRYWEPHMGISLDVPHHDDVPDYKLPEGGFTAVCKSTITYMLDGQVGLLADLALIAQVAALARERNRTFLIDDTYWNRGRWTDHFQNVRARQPGPEPGCRAPPPEELVACPRTARHWVVNSRTAKYHLGHGFSDNYEDAYAHQLNRLKPHFQAAEDSFQQTIRPNAKNAELIRLTRAELVNIISSASASSAEDGSYLSVHIRRGDRKTASYSYPGRQVPIADFVQGVTDTWRRLDLKSDPFIYVASDSAAAQSELFELLPRHAVAAFSLSQSGDPEIRNLASPGEYIQHEFNMLEKEVRITATRGIIVDFALVSGMWAWENELIPDATVCTISSNVCKMAAVGLGWDRAFGTVDNMGSIDEKQKRWVEIDQKGQVLPAWEPFELFN